MSSEKQQDITSVLKDKKIVISAFFGEIGWELQRFQAHLRFLKFNVYQDWDFIVMIRPHMHVFYDDFVSYSIDFPDWFYDLGLDVDGYEAVEPGTPAGGYTPPKVYQNIVLLLHNICRECAKYQILLPPRGCDMVVESRPQVFRKFIVPKKIESENPVIVVFPRARVRASIRNVPEFVWSELVSKLTETFTVVLAGTPSGACLGHLQGDNIVNLINYNELDKTEKLIAYLNMATCSVSSQSGGTHISLLSGCPSYIIGHEKDRHAVRENRLNAPTSFRVVADYRAIDADTIMSDLRAFIKALFDSNWFIKINRPALKTLIGKKDLVGVEIGTDTGLNALNILENLDIKKLYLIDPYTMYRDLKNIGCNIDEEQCARCKKEAHERLEKYKDKIVWIEDLSENAVDLIPDELDFVYVDGNHRYEYVKKDAELYYPKLKEGGLIAFHDYDYDQVKVAVNEMFPGIQSDVCSDNAKRLEAWHIKPTSVDNLLSQDYNKLMDLVNNV